MVTVTREVAELKCPSCSNKAVYPESMIVEDFEPILLEENYSITLSMKCGKCNTTWKQGFECFPYSFPRIDPDWNITKEDIEKARAIEQAALKKLREGDD